MPDLILTNVLAYLINIASGERSAAIAASREKRIKEILESEDSLQKAIASTQSLRNDIQKSCITLLRNRAEYGVNEPEEPLLQLLSDDAFQDDLTEWFKCGAIKEGNLVKERILAKINDALTRGSTSSGSISKLTENYFENIEKTLFSNPVLSHWRHQLSLDYLREQVALLRQRADEAVGIYSLDRQNSAIERYCATALAAWDIIDLTNLPEGDVQISMQKLLLRQLYMPLRIEIDQIKNNEEAEAALSRLEEDREIRRRHEAGHYIIKSRKKIATRVSIGDRLKISRRLVVLGDPGGGKTTMLRKI